MGKIRKTIIIVTAVLAAAGTACGAYCAHSVSIADSPAGKADIARLSTGDIGRRVNVTLEEDCLIPLGSDLWTYQTGDDTDYQYIALRGYSLSAGTIVNADVVTAGEGTDAEVTDLTVELMQQSLERFYELRSEGIPEGSTLTEEMLNEVIDAYEYGVSDEGRAETMEHVADFELIVTDPSVYETPMIISFCVAAAAAAVLIYALLGIKFSKKQLVTGTLVLAAAALITAAVLLRKDISTMRSLKPYEAPGTYTIDICEDYRLDEVMARGSDSERSLMKVLSDELFGGYPVSVDTSSFSCCSFSCRTEDGTHLFGRNYDFAETDHLIIYTHPEGGYASIGMADLSFLNLAGELQYHEPDSLTGRILLRAAPYLTLDGINEKGVGVSILMLDNNEIHQDQGRNDIIILVAMRAILDTCASTDEALELLQSYDMHSMAGYSFHLFITDRSGRSVVTEWVGNEMHVTETDAVTNYYMYNREISGDSRYPALISELEAQNGILSIDEASSLLFRTSQDTERTQTEWSVVYDLDDFRAYIAFDRNMQDIYEVSPGTFG